MKNPSFSTHFKDLWGLMGEIMNQACMSSVMHGKGLIKFRYLCLNEVQARKTMENKFCTKNHAFLCF